MIDKFDDLISNLRNLKEDKSNVDNKLLKSLEQFQHEKELYTESSARIATCLENLKNEIEIMEEKKITLKKNLSEKNDFSSQIKMNPSNLFYKKFLHQESLLTELMKKDNYKTIYNVFLSFLIFYICIFMLESYIENKNPFDFTLFSKEFQGFTTFVWYMFVKLLFSIIFVVFINFLKGDKYLSIYFFSSLILTFSLVFKYNFPSDNFSFFLKLINYCQNTIFGLKLISYFIEKRYFFSYYSYKEFKRDSNVNENENGDELQLLKNKNMNIIIEDDGGNNDEITFKFRSVNYFIEVKNFLYFCICPTLIYRDKYPMLKQINYYKLFVHFMNIVLSFSFSLLIFQLKISSIFADGKFKLLNYGNLIQTLVSVILSSLTLLFTIFYGVFHSLLNLFAELCKFSDRKFYGGFWNSKTPMKSFTKLMYYYEDFLNFYIKPFFFSINKISNGKHNTGGNFIIHFEIIKILFYCFLLDYIFLSTAGVCTPIISFILIASSIISYPISSIKNHQIILFNWIIFSLAFGLIVMIHSIEYLVVNSDSDEWKMIELRSYMKLVPKIFYIIFK
jgi:hypothetical protein